LGGLEIIEKETIKGCSQVILFILTILSSSRGSVYADEQGVKFAVTADYFTKYIWRGQNLNDENVFQPSFSLSKNGFTASVWGNLDLTDENQNSGEFTELDYSIDYSASLPGINWVSFSAGALYYDFPHTDSKATTEVYGGLDFDLPLTPMEGILGMDIKASDVLAQERRFLWSALAVFAATVPLTLTLGLRFGHWLAAPIVKLTTGSKCIAQGDLSHRVSIKGSYETNILAQSFNNMTDTLQKAIICRDDEISSRKKAENALEAANKDLQKTIAQLNLANRELMNFAYITAHDLKTPLRGIKILTDWIATDYADKFDDDGKKSIDLLNKRVSRMYNYIDAIKQYASIGYEKENKVTVDLNELVSKVINNLSPPENIEIKIENELPIIECDKSRLKQVFLNLLDNAIRYMDKPQGRIVVRCDQEPACWKFSIADNGPGIDEKYHEKIFEIFQTLSPKDRYETAGIGLSIVKKIVELNDGQIWVQSHLGQGSTFFFTLPKQNIPAIEQNKLYASISCGPKCLK